MAQNSSELQAAIAANRFGLGAKPGEIAVAKGDPKGWLIRQIRPEGADQPVGQFPNSRERLVAFYAYQRERQQARRSAARTQAPATAAQPMTETAAEPGKPGAPDSKAQAAEFQAALRDITQDIGKEFLARCQLACNTDAAFRERWALFWFNHFTVSAVKLQSGVIANAFEREAIRPHVFGRFEDMLVASSRHPAMLLYLDQARSFGPNSRRGRFGKAGLNENLAREIMELHTVGPASGYTQADVTEFARAMTGWSVGGPGQAGATQGAYNFLDQGHEPGSRRIMGKTYPDHGESQAHAVMVDLAANPFTARRIAKKIAVHFVADDPPPRLVQHLSDAWISSGGRLDVVARALIEAPDAWDPQPHKFKTPYEFVVSCYRAVDSRPATLDPLAILTALGQKPMSANSPKGWDDTADGWAAPDAIIKRLEFAKGFAAKAGPLVDPIAVAHSALGARLGERSDLAITRAESKSESLALLFMSPEFQRR